MEITNRRFVVSPDAVSTSNTEGSTILSVRKGMLYSVIGVGNLMWTKLKAATTEGLTIDDVVDSISVDFETVPRQKIRTEVEHLLGQLMKKGLVELSETRTKGFSRRVQTISDNVSRVLLNTIVDCLISVQLAAIAAFLQLLFFDVTLTLVGYRALHSLVKSWPVVPEKPISTDRVQRICAVVDQAARWYFRHAQCLQRSAVTTCLLRSHGVPAEMVVACRRIPFKGHAWVEVAGHVVNDNPRVRLVCDNVLERC